MENFSTTVSRYATRRAEKIREQLTKAAVDKRAERDGSRLVGRAFREALGETDASALDIVQAELAALAGNGAGASVEG